MHRYEVWLIKKMKWNWHNRLHPTRWENTHLQQLMLTFYKWRPEWINEWISWLCIDYYRHYVIHQKYLYVHNSIYLTYLCQYPWFSFPTIDAKILFIWFVPLFFFLIILHISWYNPWTKKKKIECFSIGQIKKNTRIIHT